MVVVVGFDYCQFCLLCLAKNLALQAGSESIFHHHHQFFKNQISMGMECIALLQGLRLIANDILKCSTTSDLGESSLFAIHLAVL
jgi:hypothetical protein